MTMGTNGEHQQEADPPGRRTARGEALLWVLAAITCFVLALFGFRAAGPWYIFLGSILLSGAAGTFVVRAVRALPTQHPTHL